MENPSILLDENLPRDAADQLDKEREYATLRAWVLFAAFVARFSLHVPLAFMGLGVYRAWTIFVINGPVLNAGIFPVSPKLLFDAVALVVFAIAVVCSRRIGSICLRPDVSFLSMLVLVFASILGFAASALGATQTASILTAVLGGAGVALMILQWSEAYSALSPTRICIYYSLSIVVGQVIGFVCQGFRADWQPVMVAVLPLVSYACLRTCVERYGARPRAKSATVDHTFPWRPVTVVALCTLAFYLGSRNAEMALPGVSLGTFMGGAFVALLFWAFKDRLDMGFVYGTLLPFVSAALLLLSTVDELGVWRDVFSRFGYALSQIFVFTMVGAICYHWGTNPLWFFGIERLVRTSSQIAGSALASYAAAASITLLPLVYVLILLATFMILAERRLDATWGVELSDKQRFPEVSDEVRRRNALISACVSLATSKSLSQREEEVLILLAQRKTAHDIEEALCVANGTAKAHIRHVYQKLGIHTREELFEAVDQAGYYDADERRGKS